jgi:outer membrane protein
MKKLIFFIFIFQITTLVKAQEASQAPVKLTYKEAVKIAVQNNVNLNQQKNNLYSRQVQKNQTMVAFLPSVGIQGGIAHTEGQQPNPDGGELQDLSVDNINANIQAGVTLFNGFTRINTLQQGINQFKAQTSLVRRTEQDVIFNVTNQYLQVLLDQELLKIAEESFKAQQVALDQLKELANLGARAEADLFAQDAQVRNLEVTALRAKVTLGNDIALLSQILQLDPSVPFEVTYPEMENSFELNNFPLDSLYKIAVSNREDLKQADYQAKANLSAYRASANGWYPNVTAFVSYGSQYNSALRERPEYGNFDNQFKTVFPSLSYGVNVSIPLFDRFITRSNRVFNKMVYENSELQKENIEKTIKIDVRRTYNNYLAAIQAHKASEIQFKAGDLALRTQQESFTLGVASQVALAQANQVYVQAAASKAQAEVTLLFQKTLLDYAIGTLKFEE